MSERDDGLLARWSRRKALAREGVPLAPEPVTTAGDAPRTADRGSAAKDGAHAARVGVANDVARSAADGATGEASRRATTGGTAASSTEASREPDRERPDATRAAPPPTLDDVAAWQHDADFSRFMAPDVANDVKQAALKKLFGDPHFNVMDGLDVYIDDYGKPDPLPAAMLRQMAQARFLGLFHEQEEPHEDPDLRLQPHDAAGRAGADTSAVAGVDPQRPDDADARGLDADPPDTDDPQRKPPAAA